MVWDGYVIEGCDRVLVGFGHVYCLRFQLKDHTKAISKLRTTKFID